MRALFRVVQPPLFLCKPVFICLCFFFGLDSTPVMLHVGSLFFSDAALFFPFFLFSQLSVPCGARPFFLFGPKSLIRSSGRLGIGGGGGIGRVGGGGIGGVGGASGREVAACV